MSMTLRIRPSFFAILIASLVTQISALTASPPSSSSSCLGRHSVLTSHPHVQQYRDPINAYRHNGNKGWLQIRRSKPLYVDTDVHTAVRANVGDDDNDINHAGKLGIETSADYDETMLPSDPANTTTEFLAALWRLIAQGNSMVRGVSFINCDLYL
jgi:hypothetical protein